MKTAKKKNVPTSSELSLLNVLWRLGSATVRQIHDYISKTQTTGYTTVLKMLQIMHEKGLVTRDESNKAHIYTASYTEQQTQSSMLSDIVKKAFGGSKYELVVRALGEKTSSDEIADIRRLLDELEKKSK